MLENLPEFLTRWEDGSIRLAGHRIGLHIILEDQKESGMTAEQIQAQYPTLEPGLVEKVLAFCGEHQAETDQYFEEYKAIAQRNYDAWKNSEMGRRHVSLEERVQRFQQQNPGPLPDFLQALLDRRRS
jgi:uncharacterized protein (DUF433 family)